MIAPITERSGMAASDTTTVAMASRTSQLRTPAPTLATPSASSPLTSRATAICSAEPGTMRMMYADTSTASEPYPVAPSRRAKMIVNTSASTFWAITAAPIPAARPVSERVRPARRPRRSTDARRETTRVRTAPGYPRTPLGAPRVHG